MKLLQKLFIYAFISILVSCDSLSSKEVARIPVNTISDIDHPDWKITSLDLKAGEKLWFWTDMDIEYKGNPELTYQIQLIKNADTLGYIEFHPFDKKITLGEIKTTLFGKTKWSFKGSMDFLKIKENGKYTFRAILASSQNQSVKLNKADLVLKK
ncbi:MAG: hypothetical protein ACXVPU_15515 [Bacteroidia bacterium]